MLAHEGPRPLEAVLHRNQVNRNRNLFCPRYEECLDTAMEHRWMSWTCAQCVRFRPPRACAPANAAVASQGELGAEHDVGPGEVGGIPA